MEIAKLARKPLWSPLRNREYRRLWIGQTMSDFANWLDFIALGALIVYSWGHGPMAMAALSVCIGAPWVVVGPLMSVWAGRLPGKHVLVACDWLRAALVLGMIWAPSLEVLLLLVFLKMSVSSIFDPVRQSAIKRLVEAEHLAQASSLSQMSVNLTKIAAPAVGGVLVGLYGGWAAFAAGAALYACSAIVIGGLPAWRNEDQAKGELGLAKGLRGSWNHITGKPLLKAAILYTGALFFLVFLYDGLFVVIADEARLSESSYGFMIGAVGAGSVAGAMAAGQWSGWQRHPLRHMTLAGIAAGLLIVVVGVSAAGWFPVTMWMWVPLCLLLGFVGAQGATPFGFILQTETTDETIGPISALSNAVQAGSMLAAPLLGALAATRMGAGILFIAAGISMTVLAIAFSSWSAPTGRVKKFSKDEGSPEIV